MSRHTRGCTLVYMAPPPVYDNVELDLMNLIAPLCADSEDLDLAWQLDVKRRESLVNLADLGDPDQLTEIAANVARAYGVVWRTYGEAADLMYRLAVGVRPVG